MQEKWFELFVADADGKDVKQITNFGCASFAPTFTPDGKQLLFASNKQECDSSKFELFLINIDGTGLRQVTNYDAASVASTAEQMEKAGTKPRIMIDCSHANSGKDHRKQGAVSHSVSEQVANGDRHIMGAMIESNLVAGSQSIVEGKALVYGQSVTDACVDWSETHTLLRELAGAVKKRRGSV